MRQLSSVPPAELAGEDIVVLIAGSDPIADALCTALSARGADVQQLSSALAVEAIASTSPDLVLLVGDAARQRGALIRSQLVRRMRGTDVSLAVLIEGSTGGPTSAVRLISRDDGIDAIADEVMSAGQAAARARTKGTLDEVAGMVSDALKRPSQPPTKGSKVAPTPSRIVMKARPAAPSVPRATIRAAGPVPVPAGMAAPPAPSTPAAMPAAEAPKVLEIPAAPLPATRSATTLSMAPPTSLQELLHARAAAPASMEPPPPPLPEAVEVSLADMRIERDRDSGEVMLSRAPVPPLPAALPRRSPEIAMDWDATSAPPTPVAWSTEVDEEIPTLRRKRAPWGMWAGGLAAAASVGLAVWALGSDAGVQSAPSGAVASTPSTATSPPASTVAGQPAVAAVSATAHERSSSAAHRAARTDEAEPAVEESLTLADATAAPEDGDDSDPMGDEPHLVRARQLCTEGHALRTRGRLGLAEAKYLQALGLFPQYPRAIAGVVRVHLTRGDGEEALRWAERLVAMQPNRSNNQLLLGDAYALSGKRHDARRHWRKSAAYGNSTARKRLKNDDNALAKPAR